MNKFSCAIFLFIILITIGCKKWQHQYPEDLSKTKITATERLTNKWWILQSTYVNEMDYTDSVFQIFGKYQIYFSRNILSVHKDEETFAGSIKTDTQLPFSAIWKFRSRESNIIIGPENGNYSDTISIVPGYLSHWSYALWEFKILKLGATEFKISITTKNNDSTIINTFIAN